jgi:hypothetical protein
MDNRFEVTVGAGTMRSAADRVVSFPHRWTPEGVTVDADFTGGHLLLRCMTVALTALASELRGPRAFGLLGGDPAQHLPDAVMEQIAAAPLPRRGLAHNKIRHKT